MASDCSRLTWLASHASTTPAAIAAAYRSSAADVSVRYEDLSCARTPSIRFF